MIARTHIRAARSLLFIPFRTVAFPSKRSRADRARFLGLCPLLSMTFSVDLSGKGLVKLV